MLLLEYENNYNKEALEVERKIYRTKYTYEIFNEIGSPFCLHVFRIEKGGYRE